MVQFFKGRLDEQHFYKAFKPVIDNANTALNEMHLGAYTDEFLGLLLVESNAFDVGEFFDGIFIIESYVRIVDAYQALGTYEAYIELFKALFGSGTTVTFENPSPAELIVTLVTASGITDNWITKDADNLVTKDADNLVFLNPFGKLSVAETERFLQRFVPAGIKATFNLTII